MTKSEDEKLFAN